MSSRIWSLAQSAYKNGGEYDGESELMAWFQDLSDREKRAFLRELYACAAPILEARNLMLSLLHNTAGDLAPWVREFISNLEEEEDLENGVELTFGDFTGLIGGKRKLLIDGARGARYLGPQEFKSWFWTLRSAPMRLFIKHCPEDLQALMVEAIKEGRKIEL